MVVLLQILLQIKSFRGEARSHNDKSLEYQVNHMKETFETTAKELGVKQTLKFLRVILVLEETILRL